jgi:hypothetical protein
MSGPFDHLDDEQFADYLDGVGDDYAESGSEATAEDYHEAADRIRELLD